MKVSELIKELENIVLNHPEINFNEIDVSMNKEYSLNKVSFSNWKHVVTGETCYGIDLDP